ncbi:hypothetical protein ACN28E_19595 [Archangium lansingense]|uniref:hypothetical protein n=1 Tax=Archangium lansingense TaxID=2995310 RepID=UPI003B7BBBD3
MSQTVFQLGGHPAELPISNVAIESVVALDDGLRQSTLSHSSDTSSATVDAVQRVGGRLGEENSGIGVKDQGRYAQEWAEPVELEVAPLIL